MVPLPLRDLLLPLHCIEFCHDLLPLTRFLARAPLTFSGRQTVQCSDCLFVRMLVSLKQRQQQRFFGPLIQDNPGEKVLSQRRDLLEQFHWIFMSRMSCCCLPLNLRCQSTTAKNPKVWSSFVLSTLYQHPCLTNSVE